MDGRKGGREREEGREGEGGREREGGREGGRGGGREGGRRGEGREERREEDYNTCKGSGTTGDTEAVAPLPKPNSKYLAPPLNTCI